jgi:8-oxo-dGTP diphosphatase
VKIIHVSCLVLLHQGKVLATQRSEKMDLPGLWEFPGGKVEPEEAVEYAQNPKELKEKLGLSTAT